MGYTILTTGGHTYWTDDDGYVIARTNGPRGWSYGKAWQILGATTRRNAHYIIPLKDIVDGADFGQGWVQDIDHGTRRMWAGHPGRIKSVVRTADWDPSLARNTRGEVSA
jgi:citrate lyase beta subunit